MSVKLPGPRPAGPCTCAHTPSLESWYSSNAYDPRRAHCNAGLNHGLILDVQQTNLERNPKRGSHQSDSSEINTFRNHVFVTMTPTKWTNQLELWCSFSPVMYFKYKTTGWIILVPSRCVYTPQKAGVIVIIFYGWRELYFPIQGWEWYATMGTTAGRGRLTHAKVKTREKPHIWGTNATNLMEK